MKNYLSNVTQGMFKIFSVSFVLILAFSVLAPVSAQPLSQVSGSASPEIGGQSSTGSDAPGYYETSAFMIGKVSVGVVALESSASSANTEDWTPTELQNVNQEIRAGLKRWADWGSTAANLQFYVDVNGDGSADDAAVAISPVTVNVEPIANASSTYDVWTGSALTTLGYAGATTTDSWYQYANALRQTNGTDWAFIIFVVDSSTDAANPSEPTKGSFTDGRYMVAPTFGPAVVMTYTNGPTNTINNMDLVTAQLTARVFGAGFQASGYCSGTTTKFGYLAVPNTYCEVSAPTGEPNPRLMYNLTNSAGAPDSITKQQIGWKDSDGDGIYDVVDTRPIVIFSPYAPDPTTNTVLEYIESSSQQYRAYEPPLAATTCSTLTDECYYRYYTNASDIEPAVTINTIQSVQFRVDGEATWTSISGSFDTDYEVYTFSTPTLGGGKHKIEVRSTNSRGISSYSVADEVTVLVSPDNDLFSNRIQISALPYNHAVDTSIIPDDTSLDSTDPIPPASSCDAASGLRGKRSVWYWYKPLTNDGIFLDTKGSTYDTVLSIWHDDNKDGDFTNLGNTEEKTEMVACDDDGGGTYSRLSFIPTEGETYYIMISEFNNTGSSAASEKSDLGGQSGGWLIFNALTTSDVSVYIGSGIDPINTYKVKPGEGQRYSYAGVNTGPVRIISSNDTPIIATERHAWKVNGVYSSYAEMMGLPANQLTDTYIFPWYNNATMNTELRIGNVGDGDTVITVKIAGSVVETFPLAQNASARKSYAGVNNGPMEVSSLGGVKIIATHRFAWMANGVYTSITEMMGLPAGQLTDTYIFPWYNNQTMDTQLRIGNVGDANTTITVKIGGVVVDTFPLAKNTGVRPSYNLNSGPVQVSSSGGVKIIATERHAWKVNGVYQSYAEMMGLPGGALSDQYVFPWYNNVTMNSELRIGNVGSGSTTITVKIAGQVVDSFTLARNASARKSYAYNNGPMEVASSGGVKIITTHRFAWMSNGIYTSITEMMGLPYEQLTNAYVFPWYNNSTMDTQLRFGAP